MTLATSAETAPGSSYTQECKINLNYISVRIGYESKFNESTASFPISGSSSERLSTEPPTASIGNSLSYIHR